MNDKPAEEAGKSLAANLTAHTAGQGDLFGDPTRDEVADYIGEMLQELRDLAKASGLGTLGAILELAEQHARREIAPPRAAGRGGS